MVYVGIDGKEYKDYEDGNMTRDAMMPEIGFNEGIMQLQNLQILRQFVGRNLTDVMMHLNAVGSAVPDKRDELISLVEVVRHSYNETEDTLTKLIVSYKNIRFVMALDEEDENDNPTGLHFSNEWGKQ